MVLNHYKKIKLDTMKSFKQYITTEEKKKPTSYFDVGHHRIHRDMKHVELYHNGAVSGHDSVNHLKLYKNKRDAHERKTGYEMHPDSANHETWIEKHPKKRVSKAITQAGDPEHFVQGRIDHKKKEYSINNSIPDKEDTTSTTHQARVIKRLIRKTKDNLSNKYPEYTVHDHSGIKGYHIENVTITQS
jgi:hypothetical protein